MLGGHLLETKNKRIKTGHSHLRKLSSGRLRESSWNSIWPMGSKMIAYKVITNCLQSDRLWEVVAYEKWSLWESWILTVLYMEYF